MGYSVNIPIIECWLRAEELAGGTSYHGLAVQAWAYMAVSLPGQAMRFNAYLANGLLWDGVPLNQLRMRAAPCDEYLLGHRTGVVEEAPPSLEELQGLNCPPGDVSLESRRALQGRPFWYRPSHSEAVIRCDYGGLSFGWLDTGHLNRYGEGVAGVMHLLVRPDGYLALQPNELCNTAVPGNDVRSVIHLSGHDARRSHPWENSAFRCRARVLGSQSVSDPDLDSPDLDSAVDGEPQPLPAWTYVLVERLASTAWPEDHALVQDAAERIAECASARGGPHRITVNDVASLCFSNGGDNSLREDLTPTVLRFRADVLQARRESRRGEIWYDLDMNDAAVPAEPLEGDRRE